MGKTIALGVGLLSASLAWLFSAAALAYDPIVKTANGIEYLNGGVGTDERALLHCDFPLKLVFAAAGGPYLSGVRVVIMEKGGKTAVFDLATDNGPWLFVNLPAGSYQVRAEHRGVERSASFEIAGPAYRNLVTLLWPSS